MGLNYVPHVFCQDIFISEVEPVRNVAGRQAGTRSLCLRWKCLEMNFPTLLSFVLSICKRVAPMMEEHIQNTQKRISLMLNIASIPVYARRRWRNSIPCHASTQV